MKILLINGKEVDLDDKVNINLSYKSPIFSNFSKLCADTTLTIKLPLTAHNKALIGNVNIVGVQSNFPYDYFRVDYINNGLTIIDNGTGYLLGTSEAEFEMSVIFGGVSEFTKLKDVKLNKLPIPVEQGQIEWVNKYEIVGEDIMFISMDYGMGVSVGQHVTEYSHPSVTVKKIIAWINESYNISLPIELGNTFQEWTSMGLVLPCVTKKRRENYTKPYKFRSDYNNVFIDPISGLINIIDLRNMVEVGSFTIRRMGNSAAESRISFISNAKISIKGNYTVSLFGVDTIVNITRFNINNEWHTISEENPIISIDVNKNVEYRIVFEIDNSYGEYLLSSAFVEIDLVGDELTFAEKFDTIYNLPDMKITEFIKALSILQGKFLKLSNGGFSLVSIDDIFDNISNAKDWSDKLLKVKSVSYQLPDWAQSNIINWTEDDTDISKVDKGVLSVENKTLSAEKIMYKLPFAATYPVDHAIIILPLYTQKTPDDDIEFNSLKPRILDTYFRRVLSPCTLVFGGDNGIIANKYKKYQDIIKQPIVVQCEIMLQASDLSMLDMTIPVYIEQLNGYFIPLSITTKDFISDIELLRL